MPKPSAETDSRRRNSIRAGVPMVLAPSAPPPGAVAPLALDEAFVIETARLLPQAGGGPQAYAAAPRAGGRGALMAVQVRPDAAPRAAAMARLAGLSDPRILAPIACGPAKGADGKRGWFVVCPAPPGPALWANTAAPPPALTEAALIEQVLRPVAGGLAVLAERGVTHRAIRPDNLFRAGEGAPALLGCAWAAPPAMFQPAVFEPAYSAMCAPLARGDGGIADDVYALGVVLLALTLGRIPLAGLDDETVVQRLLDLGSFAALTEGIRLPPLLADLLPGMLADDPQHRPPPSLLADPAAARARHVAKRQPRRAAQPLSVDGIAVWHTRMLAYALARRPAAGARLLRLGVVDHWLRRSLGDTMLAAKLEEAVRPRATDPAVRDGLAGTVGAMRAIAQLDPLAPLCWDGMALWPDALGPVLAALPLGPDPAHGAYGDLVAAEACALWAAARPDAEDMLGVRVGARGLRAMLAERGWSGGLARLRYALNPLLSCRSPLLAGHAAVQLPDLLPALEAAAAPAAAWENAPADRELVAFIAARRGGGIERDLAALADASPPDEAALALLRLLAPLQQDGASGPLPRLAGWLAARAGPRLEAWRNRPRRAQKQALLAETAATGVLTAVLAVLDNAAERQADEQDYRLAVAEAEQIDAELAALGHAAAARAAAARQVGQEAAAAIALALLSVCAVAAAAG